MAWIVIVNGNNLTTEQRLKELLMSATQDAVNAITAQLGKAKDEILTEIETLKANNPELDLTGLEAAAQALDDVVPDQTAE